jgi:hypothetical protein
VSKRDQRDDTHNSVTYQLGGWGDSCNPAKAGRRGGFWRHYTFNTLKEARAEQQKQLSDQAWKVKQKALDLKKAMKAKTDGFSNTRQLLLRRVEHRWGEDFGHPFPIFKVTQEFIK